MKKKKKRRNRSSENGISRYTGMSRDFVRERFDFSNMDAVWIRYFERIFERFC